MAKISVSFSREVDPAISEEASRLLEVKIGEFVTALASLEQQAIAEGRIAKRDGSGQPCAGCGK